jgi:hypothetical protein
VQIPDTYSVTATDVGTAGGRLPMGLSRTTAEAAWFGGELSTTKTGIGSNDPAPGSTVKVGYASDNYNPAGSSDDVFYGVAFFSNVYLTEADLVSASESFQQQVGFRTPRQVSLDTNPSN